MVLPYYYITLKGNIKSMKAGSDKRKETSHLVLLSALTEGRDLEAEQALSAALIYLFSNQHLHHHLCLCHNHHHDRKYLAHALFRKLPSHGGSIYPKKIFFANITFKFKDLRSPTGSNKFLNFYACLFIRSSPLLKASIDDQRQKNIPLKIHIQGPNCVQFLPHSLSSSRLCHRLSKFAPSCQLVPSFT